MNKPTFYSLCATFFLTGALSTVNAQNTTWDGAELFIIKSCVGCHGEDGRTPVMPQSANIAGQNKGYLYNQMRDIKNGNRNNGLSFVMTGIMKNVSPDEMQTIATWLSTQ